MAANDITYEAWQKNGSNNYQITSTKFKSISHVPRSIYSASVN